MELVLKIMMLILILFSLSKTRRYMFLYQFYQKRIIKNYQNFLVNDLKDQFVGMNIKEKERIKMQQMDIDIFSNQTLLGLTDYLCKIT